MTKSRDKLLEELDDISDKSNVSFLTTLRSNSALNVMQTFQNLQSQEVNDKLHPKLLLALSSKTSDISDASMEASENETPERRMEQRSSKYSSPNRRLESMRSNQLRGRQIIITKNINNKEKRIKQL